ncbi:MAG: DNA cytosine methyltransferase [Roseomonas sp.]|nr:DNA cytosine methyltransferase [Roseomonas sp.]
MFRYGSVCSGIEAASVAWHGLGWRASFLSEIDAFPRAVLAHHYPDTPLHGDFTTIEEDQYEPIDLLVGGTPCQSFSIAGLRGGLADDRGNLALEFLRLADRTRPRWLVWENVPGVLSSNGGRDFGSIIGGMVKLGYGIAYRVLDAQYFGVAQRRRRVFVVGYLGDWRRAAAVLFERASLRWDTPPRRKTREGLAPSLAARTTGGGGLGTDAELDGAVGALCRDSFSGGAGGRPEGAASGHFLAVNSAVRRLTPRECERLQGFPDDYTLIPYRGKPAADGPRYKALGNSMAVPVMRWIGDRIAKVEACHAP